MRTDIKSDRHNRVRAKHGRGRRKLTVAELDAYYMGNPDAVRLACLRLLADVLRGVNRAS